MSVANRIILWSMRFVTLTTSYDPHARFLPQSLRPVRPAAGFWHRRRRLDQAYRGIQAEIHPDKFAHAGDAEQRLAMQWATRVNEAYQTLRKPFERARYLLELHGIDAMDAKNTAMPADFLMQQMEWREALMEARAGKDIAALQALENELKAQARQPANPARQPAR